MRKRLSKQKPKRKSLASGCTPLNVFEVSRMFEGDALSIKEDALSIKEDEAE